MKSANIAMIRNRLSHYLRLVRKGETVQILDRDLPIARIVPIPPPGPNASPDDEEARLQRLERAGVIRRGTGEPVAEILKGFPPGTPPSGVLDALLEERRTGR